MDQRIEAMGTVVRDPEFKETSNGKTFARVTVAADEVTLNGERLDAKEGNNKWQTAVFWEKDAQTIAETVRKGDKVKVTGNAVEREYQDRSGATKKSVELHKATIETLEKRQALGPSVEAVGNLVRDPEVKHTPNGKTFARLTVAADEVKIDGKAVDPEKHKWQTAIVWDRDAERAASALKKGASVRLTGEQITREYENKEGQKKSSQELHRANFEVLERAKSRTGSKPKDKGDELSR
jgi:single-strand DNA-binding protein